MSPLRENILEFRILTLCDKDAFGEYYQLQKLPIYRFILTRTSSPDIAEDLTSEVFLKACQFIFEEERRVSHLRGFLFSIARSSIVDYYRRVGGREEMIEPEDSILNKLVDNSLSAMEQMEMKIEMEALRRVLKDLKREQSEIIVLRFMDGLSIEEISAVLGKSRGAVRVLLHRSLREIEKRIEIK